MDEQQKLKDLAISDSGFVFDPYSGATFNVNATGHAILVALKAGADRQEIIAALRERFDAEMVDLERDLDDFLQTLRREQILPMDSSR